MSVLINLLSDFQLAKEYMIVTLSRMKSVDLVFSHFLSYFILFSIYFHIFLFIELRVRVSHVTQEERHRSVIT